MNDREYNKLKKVVLGKMEDKKMEYYRWDMDFLSLIKNKKAFVDFVNSVRKEVAQTVFDDIVDVIDKKYIDVEKIPTTKEFFKIINDRIKSNEEDVGERKKELFGIKKKMLSAKKYDDIKKLESDEFWAKHSMNDAKKEIIFYGNIKDCIKSDIRSREKSRN